MSSLAWQTCLEQVENATRGPKEGTVSQSFRCLLGEAELPVLAILVTATNRGKSLFLREIPPVAEERAIQTTLVFLGNRRRTTGKKGKRETGNRKRHLELLRELTY